MTTDEASVLSERRGVAQWITINRESRRNALNPSVIEGIRTSIVAAAADPAVRAIVITGVGEKAFCAGADLAQGADAFGDSLDEPTTDFGRLARTAREIGVPLIARVNGACVAGGMALMSLCDLAVAADHAKFGLPETKVGVFPMQVAVYLRRILHPRHFNQLCLTGAFIDARRACEIGLVNEAVAFAQLDARIGELVDLIAATSPVAVRRGKAALATMESMPFAEAFSYAEAQIVAMSRTDDAREGIAAFMEKRPPRWAPKKESKD